MYQRLQKLGLCLSHYQTLKVIDDMGEDFDAKVMMWKGHIEEEMETNKVGSVCSCYLVDTLLAKVVFITSSMYIIDF